MEQQAREPKEVVPTAPISQQYEVSGGSLGTVYTAADDYDSQVGIQEVISAARCDDSSSLPITNIPENFKQSHHINNEMMLPKCHAAGGVSGGAANLQVPGQRHSDAADEGRADGPETNLSLDELQLLTTPDSSHDTQTAQQHQRNAVRDELEEEDEEEDLLPLTTNPITRLHNVRIRDYEPDGTPIYGNTNSGSGQQEGISALFPTLEELEKQVDCYEYKGRISAIKINYRRNTEEERVKAFHRHVDGGCCFLELRQYIPAAGDFLNALSLGVVLPTAKVDSSMVLKLMNGLAKAYTELAREHKDAEREFMKLANECIKAKEKQEEKEPLPVGATMNGVANGTHYENA